MKQFKKALFIFHRDLRLADNTGLNAALSQAEQVIPVFIFDPLQVSEANHYRSLPALQFMVESLDDLASQLHKRGGKLFLFAGPTSHIVERLMRDEKVDAVFSNRDYTPFARERDKTVEKSVIKHAGAWFSYDDALLCNPDTLVTGKGTPYTIYTAFLKKAVQTTVPEPTPLMRGSWFDKAIAHTLTLAAFKKEQELSPLSLAEQGGRTAAKKILNRLDHFTQYARTRDYPTHPTTGLSAHLKFGTISVREAFQAIKAKKADATLIKQLYWRDFFTYLAYHFPSVFGKAFREKYRNIAWSNNEQWFVRWCEGKTGFPLVDAGMRQLNATGYMHNRVRMVVASFLTKDMHIDWRKGERYFAQHLVDYDPCVNNGNWQWSASTGADAQPYFRIFNPWLQQKKFDPGCDYIKQWVPELRSLSSKEIHAWYKASASKNGYPLPVLDHAQESKKAITQFKSAR